MPTVAHHFTTGSVREENVPGGRSNPVISYRDLAHAVDGRLRSFFPEGFSDKLVSIMTPEISIIVPSRGRPERVGRLLACLDVQRGCPAGRFEVIIALDGCSPAQLDALPRDVAFALEYLKLEQVGISAAKNAAIARSQGRVLLFLNDDVEPELDFVRAHAAAQAAGHAVVLGHSPWVTYDDQTVFDEMIARTRMIFFYADLKDGRDYDFRHAWNLNLSVRRDLLPSGSPAFDEAFRPCMYEDLVFAYRLRGGAAKVHYVAAARAPHRHRHTLRGYFEREAMLGVMAPVLAEVAPECFAAIFGCALEDGVAAARAAVGLDHADKRRVLSHLRKATAPGVTGEVDHVLLDALYHAHLPLKRQAFRRGLLAALDHPETDWRKRSSLAVEALVADAVFSQSV